MEGEKLQLCQLKLFLKNLYIFEIFHNLKREKTEKKKQNNIYTCTEKIKVINAKICSI